MSRLGYNRDMSTRLFRVSCAIATAAALATAIACSGSSSGASAADAKKFIDDVNETLLKLETVQGQAGWVSENFITDDTEALNARESQILSDTQAKVRQKSLR